MMEVLKPCPFCGGGVIGQYEWDGYIDVYWIECDDCCARTDRYASEELAIEAWNRRIE